MNEFAAKKLGEVLAFARVGKKLLVRADGAFGEVFNDTEELRLEFERQDEKIVEFVNNNSVADIAIAKSEKTGVKLMSMAEMYIGDEWDNPAEIMEWMGFFLGGAIIHWKLVEGAMREDDVGFLAFAEKSTKFYENILKEDGERIWKYAAEKSG